MPDPSEPGVDPNKPKRMTADDQSVEQHSLADQIAADDRKLAAAAVKRKRRGLLYNRMSPGDAV